MVKRQLCTPLRFRAGSTTGSDAQKLEDVPELIHQIQSCLPVEVAARTSILSKSWLHAWSTIPHLRFHHAPTICNEQGGNALELFNRTLMRYLDDNIPIETFKLDIELKLEKDVSLVEKWLLLLAIKARVKELSLTLDFHRHVKLNFPLEIFSSESITKLRIVRELYESDLAVEMTSRHDPVIIKCVSLRELRLDRVYISQEILDGILSCCSSLEKIELSHCTSYLNTIKVENLPCLYDLRINTFDDDTTDFVISNVPNLRYFLCHVVCDWTPRPLNAHSVSLGSSVTELTLSAMICDKTSLDMITSGLPFLESLTLDMEHWKLGSFHFTSASIKRLSLLRLDEKLIHVQVHAPKLIFFKLDGSALPTLLFPISTIKVLRLEIYTHIPVDASFFLKMREALTLSRKCYIDIRTVNSIEYKLSLDIDISDLRTRLLLPPASNVHELKFGTFRDKCLWERSPFFDAFFEVCHPKYVVAVPDERFARNNHFCRMIWRDFIQRNKTGTGTGSVYWPAYLESVQIKWPSHENWETLTNSHITLIDWSTPGLEINFKLKWLTSG